MEKFKHPEVPEGYKPEKSKEEDIYEKIEVERRIDAETRAKLLESVNVSQIMAILQGMLQNHNIEGDIVLTEYLDAIQEEQNELRRDKKYEDANILESTEGIINDAINAGYLNNEMTIDQMLDAFSLRWSELREELDKKGLKI